MRVRFMPFRGRELKTFNASLGCYVGRFNAQIYKFYYQWMFNFLFKYGRLSVIKEEMLFNLPELHSNKGVVKYYSIFLFSLWLFSCIFLYFY